MNRPGIVEAVNAWKFAQQQHYVHLDPTLIATAHLDAALSNETFSVSVRVRHEYGSVGRFADIAVLTTNAQGKSNVHVQVDTNPPAGSTTLRRVALRFRRAPKPLCVAVGWDLQLKPMVRPPNRRAD